MAGRIHPDSIVQIRESFDIVDWIERHGPVALKKSGKSHMGLCPFHQEKTPSFHVWRESGNFKCFGCGVGGSIIDFVMGMDRLDFREAVELLADRGGVELRYEGGRDAEAPKGPSRKDLEAAHEWAAGWFRERIRDRQAGAACRDYVIDRQIDPKVARSFGLGWAPDSWDELVVAARAAGFGDEVLVEAGLAKPRDDGSRPYAAFRGRLMFPIRDSLGRCLAFGGRVLDGQEPKYLNSPETRLFSKSRVLYGLHGLDPGEWGAILVMEGYTDVIMAAQVGCRAAVATLGTSLTIEHARLLARYGERIILVYDGDAAGRRAAERGAAVFGALDLDLRIARLPVGRDPFDHLLEEGEGGVRALIEDSRDFFDFVLDEILERHDLASVSGRSRAAGELLGLARSVRDTVKRGLVLERGARRLGVDRNDLEVRFREEERRQTRREPFRALPRPGETAPEPAPERVSPARRRAEREVLVGLLAGAGRDGAWRDRLPADGFRIAPLARILEVAIELAGLGVPSDWNSILDRLEDEKDREALSRLVPEGEMELTRAEALLDGALRFFDRHRENLEIQRLKESGDLGEIARRLRERGAGG